jgi:hypothetical protein
MIAFSKVAGVQLTARNVLDKLYRDAPSDVQKTVEERTDRWIPFLEKKGHDLPKAILEDLKSEWAIPF